MRAYFLLVLIGVMGWSNSLMSQKMFTKQGEVSFISEIGVETIDAVNNQANSVLDMATGNVQWAVLIKAFRFEKALMEEHFNENYMESSKHPKATFKGTIKNFDAFDSKSTAPQTFTVEGDLTIHGVTQPVEVQITLTVSGDKLIGESAFSIKLADYDIDIPQVVVENIAEQVNITVKANYEELKK